MAQQTAVQCLIDELRSGEKLQFEMTKCGHIITVLDNVLDKILQMEKDQILRAHFNGSQYPSYSEDYYTKTYGKP